MASTLCTGDMQTGRAAVESRDAPHVLWFDCRLDERKGVIAIRYAPACIGSARESVKAFEGRVLAAVLDAACGALGKDLWGLSAPPVPQNGKGSTSV